MNIHERDVIMLPDFVYTLRMLVGILLNINWEWTKLPFENVISGLTLAAREVSVGQFVNQENGLSWRLKHPMNTLSTKFNFISKLIHHYHCEQKWIFLHWTPISIHWMPKVDVHLSFVEQMFRNMRTKPLLVQETVALKLYEYNRVWHSAIFHTPGYADLSCPLHTLLSSQLIIPSSLCYCITRQHAHHVTRWKSVHPE